MIKEIYIGECQIHSEENLSNIGFEKKCVIFKSYAHSLINYIWWIDDDFNIIICNKLQ